MSFIVRNLGWILLLIFFLFMLFVISLSSKNRDNNPGVIKNDVADKVEVISNEASDLDILNQKIKESQEEEIDSSTKNSNKGAIDESVEETNEGESKMENEKVETVEEEKVVVKEMDEDTQGFLARIFGRGADTSQSEKGENEKDSSLEEENNQEIIEEKDKTISEAKNDIAEKQANKVQDVEATKVFEELFTKTQGVKSSKASSGYVKTVSDKKPVTLSREARTYLSESSVLPGVFINPKLGNKYNIGVHALKLNNKYFTKTLDYLNRSDVLVQKTKANSYGCFEIEVINSNQKSKIGKRGYVCKKWLNDISSENTDVIAQTNTTIQEVKQDQALNRIQDSNKTFKVTNIGHVHTITSEVTQGGVLLEVTDTLDQMSEMNVNGCFTALINYSQNADKIGKIIQACSNSIY